MSPWKDFYWKKSLGAVLGFVYYRNDPDFQAVMTKNGYQIFNERSNQVEDPCAEMVCINVFRVDF